MRVTTANNVNVISISLPMLTTFQVNLALVRISTAIKIQTIFLLNTNTSDTQWKTPMRSKVWLNFLYVFFWNVHSVFRSRFLLPAMLESSIINRLATRRIVGFSTSVLFGLAEYTTNQTVVKQKKHLDHVTGCK